MLRKDDPIYYREKVKKLLKQAKEYGIEITLNEGYLSFAVYPDKEFFEEWKSTLSGVSRYSDIEALRKDPICKASVNINDFIV